MAKIHCKVVNPKGMHARAAAKIVELACQYCCKVKLTHKGRSAPANSLIKLLTLNAPQGSDIIIEACGEDSAELLKKIQELFRQGFGE